MKVVRYTTGDEIAYINELLKTGKISVLRKYRNSMHLRADWGSIDPTVVRRYIDNLPEMESVT